MPPHLHRFRTGAIAAGLALAPHFAHAALVGPQISALGNIRYEIRSCTVIATPATCDGLTLTVVAGTDNIRIGKPSAALVPEPGDIKLELVMTGIGSALIQTVLTQLEGERGASVGFDFASDPGTRIDLLAAAFGFIVTPGAVLTANLLSSNAVVSIQMDLAGLAGTINSVVFGPAPAAVPAPAGLALFGLALAGLAVARRRHEG